MTDTPSVPNVRQEIPQNPSGSESKQAQQQQPLTHYGKAFFHLSKAYNSWAKLTATDVFRLQTRPGFEGQNIYFFLNHPIRWVRLVGVIIGFDQFETRKLIYLDDGSGQTISVIYFEPKPDAPGTQNGTSSAHSAPVDFRNIDLHSVVKVKGEIEEYRGERQIKLRKIELLKDTNAEVDAWASGTKFKRDVLLKPWVIPEKEVQKVKRKLESDQEECTSKKRKLEPIVHETSISSTQEEQKPKKFWGRRREKRSQPFSNKLDIVPENAPSLSDVKRSHENVVPQDRKLKRSLSDVPPQKELKRSRMGNASDPLPASSSKKIKRVREEEPESEDRKKIKMESIDTIADRKRIQEILQQRENLEIAAAREGKQIDYAKHGTRAKERLKSGESSRPNSKSSSSSRRPLSRSNSQQTVEDSGFSQSKPVGTKPTALSRDSKQMRADHNGKLEKSSQRSLPTPSSPPDPNFYTYRKLKLVILRRIHSTSMTQFTIASLRLIPEIETYATKVALAQHYKENATKSKNVSLSALVFRTYCDILQTLVEDGNIIRVPPYTSHAYVAVGKWNLGDLIEEEMAAVKKCAARKAEQGEKDSRRPTYPSGSNSGTKKLAVRSIWLKAKTKGRGWEGVTKGVVADIVKEVLEAEGGWTDVGRGLWQWDPCGDAAGYIYGFRGAGI